MSDKRNVFDTKAADSDDSGTKDTDPESVDASTLSVVKTKMAEILAKDRGEEPVPLVETPDKPKDSKVEDEPEDSDTDEEVKDSDADEKVEDSKAKDDGSVMLPSGHRRAALARGYTNEEIDYFLESDPKEAVARLEKVYNEWQETSVRYSDAGRKLRAAQQYATERGEDKEVKVASKAATDEPLIPIDAKALVEKYGQEDLINEIVGPLNKSIAHSNAVAERLAKSEEFLRSTQENALGDAIQEFFTSKDMEPFKKTFGTVGNLTEKQVASRTELLGQADILSAGALDHGSEISIREALERAHMIVSHTSIDETIRQKIHAGMKKRTKTVRSSHKKTAPGSEEKTMDSLEKQVAAKQRALQGR